uniref:Uncharacterized protein n=2 Tax=Oryza punctata TaxID=4537 RepID=A0A0E0K920_ORYPU
MEGRCGVTAELGAGVGAMEGAMQLGWPDAVARLGFTPRSGRPHPFPAVTRSLLSPNRAARPDPQSCQIDVALWNPPPQSSRIIASLGLNPCPDVPPSSIARSIHAEDLEISSCDPNPGRPALAEDVPRKYDRNKAMQVWAEMERKEFVANMIWEEFEFNELEDGYHAADREGWPVYIEKPGKVDRKKLMQITSADVHVVGLKNFSNTAKELVHHTQKRGND